MQKVEMIVERTETGYSAYAKKHSVYTTGNISIMMVGIVFEKKPRAK